MTTTTEIVLWPEEAFDEKQYPRILYTKLGLSPDDVTIRPLKRSIDARSRKVCVRLQVEILQGAARAITHQIVRTYHDVRRARQVIVVGSGPAGLFAALRLIELGIKPIVLERGKDVQSRRRDLAAINKDEIVNPDSNYCFGEGGAGTYSDGKLYTRSGKRGSIARILETMVHHGANADIAIDAHPHIGTNKLPRLVAALRQTIIDAGGQVLFDTRVTDIVMKNNLIESVVTHKGDKVEGEAVILATGHSARDIFDMLRRRQVLMHAKPFALGVRVEHQQQFIDRVQYHCAIDRGPYLPASSYALVHQAQVKGQERGVFSFCMCPGGFIVPSATAPGEVVVNGMSPSRRDSAYANSGIVVSVSLDDFGADDSLAGVRFQSAIEQRACVSGGGTQHAPAQRLADYVENKTSASLLDTSYQPGLTSVDMRDVLPAYLSEALRQGFIAFGKKMKGYLTNEAQIVGVESRTSSPVRIPRHPDTLQHVEVANLYPCGEGAGYAGGIVSAAIDGERCAEALATQLGVTITP